MWRSDAVLIGVGEGSLLYDWFPYAWAFASVEHGGQTAAQRFAELFEAQITLI